VLVYIFYVVFLIIVLKIFIFHCFKSRNLLFQSFI